MGMDTTLTHTAPPTISRAGILDELDRASEAWAELEDSLAQQEPNPEADGHARAHLRAHFESLAALLD
ncbi:hypothetical protein [Deinococcus arenicola]|uniref:Uncharacterized protein n=1 Tax=Deinococcus arenicola TaxID=2994950 RepID=A0ABU4DVG0_9DEIO|nr:hypothetical protein [Deinococcus sp. ZS9-10]MDV6376433.1 hypothetical protein [Deinococcus sp. ZS9-10]